ncbi:B domain protein [Treponema vincentii ATCC 35580]|uniref:B domain protein n=1 Tax=Treponema vincentii ATCC 35580 TaxID=596324 RepID=C8PRM9_9SPIR|nr:hypothetical protein [Treponema vincentii]EEV19882.1 B domain protein [Treponema vincentii ATCC 35580]
MKKLRLISVSILFAALCLAFTACNQGLTAGKGTGEVRIVIDNGATRAVNAEGMPQFDESNTKITVTGEDGNQLAEGTTSVTLTLDIGKKINIKVVVTTDAGEWRGTKEHTVTAGTNTVAVKLSKTPLNVGNILSYVVKNDLYDSEITLKLVGKLPDEKLLVENSRIGGNYLDRPVIARDSIGRIYMLYDTDSRHLTRFDAEGNPHCEIDLNALQNPSSPSIRITTMTVDAKTNTIFVFDANSKNIYALTESESKTFIHSNPFDLNSLADVAPADTVTAAAAYNGALFLAASGNHTNKLIACDVTLSGTSLTLDEKTVETLDKLRPASSGVTGGSADTECTGLFTDESGVYCLLREQKSDASQLYMVGALVQYTYSDGALTKKQAIGLHSKAGGSDPSLAFDANAFVNPVCFIGYDKDYLYIADDGAEISENAYMGGFYTAGNKNRIAAVKRDTTALSFDDSTSDATWFAEYTAQYAEKIPTLLWSTNKGTYAVTINLKTADGSIKTLASNIRNQKTARDSTGAVYILYHKDSKLLLERFAADGTRDESFGTAKSGFDLNDLDAAITDIAVDFKTGDVFLLKRKNNISDPKITAYMAKKTDGGYTNFSAAAEVTVPKDPSSPAHIDSVAAFDGTLFVAMDVEESTNAKKKLYAYTMNTSSIGAFSLNETANEPLPELRSGTSMPTQCTGLFADGQGVYALLTQQDPYSDISPYALGQVVRFSYDGSTLTEDTSVPNSGGLNPAASGTGALVYNPAYLSNPAGFIGYDGDTLYFADDGVNIEYKNENYRINGNKDRIMAFNRKDKTVSFISADEASWSEIYNEYRKPNTKVLLWENGKSPVVGMKYWLSDDGSTASPDNADALWASTSSSENPTDVFCYDQDGNLYILWKDNSNNYKVRRFDLQPPATAEGKEDYYDKAIIQDANLNLQAGETVSAIAVDVSDGTNYLYCADNGTHKIHRYSWPSSFDSAYRDAGYSISVGDGTKTVTALAANKDGVFAGVRLNNASLNPTKYFLSVEKYKKTDGNSAGGTSMGQEDIPAEPTDSSPYEKIEKSINGLQIVDDVLYAITAKEEHGLKDDNGYQLDSLKNSGELYKIGRTDQAMPYPPLESKAKPADDTNKIGYGFYRFIAVKPKKLVIASDGAWGTDGISSSNHVEANNNKVFEYDLEKTLLEEKADAAGGKFSKELIRDTSASGFDWK